MSATKIYVDIETTGLDPNQGAVALSIAAICDGDVPHPEFVIDILPTDEQWAAASPEALAVNGMTLDYLVENGVDPDVAYAELNAWLEECGVDDKTLWVGQNPEFDHKFLAPHIVVAKPTSYLDNRALYDTLVPAKLPRLKKRSGRWISIALRVDPEPDVHTAIEGARVVKRNHDKLVQLGAKQNPRPFPAFQPAMPM